MTLQCKDFVSYSSYSTGHFGMESVSDSYLGDLDCQVFMWDSMFHIKLILALCVMLNKLTIIMQNFIAFAKWR